MTTWTGPGPASWQPHSHSLTYLGPSRPQDWLSGGTGQTQPSPSRGQSFTRTELEMSPPGNSCPSDKLWIEGAPTQVSINLPLVDCSADLVDPLKTGNYTLLRVEGYKY